MKVSAPTAFAFIGSSKANKKGLTTSSREVKGQPLSYLLRLSPHRQVNGEQTRGGKKPWHKKQSHSAHQGQRR